jgi:hypothetical protein
MTMNMKNHEVQSETGLVFWGDFPTSNLLECGAREQGVIPSQQSFGAREKHICGDAEA